MTRMYLSLLLLGLASNHAYAELEIRSTTGGFTVSGGGNSVIREADSLVIKGVGKEVKIVPSIATTLIQRSQADRNAELIAAIDKIAASSPARVTCCVQQVVCCPKPVVVEAPRIPCGITIRCWANAQHTMFRDQNGLLWRWNRVSNTWVNS